MRTAPCSASAGSHTDTCALVAPLRAALRSAAFLADQVGAILLERAEILPVCEREDEIEIPPTLGRRSAYQLEVARREHHRRQCAERVGETAGHGAVDRDFLPLGVAIEPDGDVVLIGRVRLARDVKAGRAEARQVLVARAPLRAKRLQIVDRFQQVRLALTVVADDRESLGGRQIESLEVRKF